MCLAPTPGRVDVFLCSEAMEAARALAAGWIDGTTTVIASTHRVLATIEKMAMGDGRFDADAACEALRRVARRAVLFDMQAERARAGTAVSAVMLGALVGAGVLPLRREDALAAIRASGRGVEASVRGFEAGCGRAAQETTGRDAAGAQPMPDPAASGVAMRAGIAADGATPPGGRRVPLDPARAAALGEARCAAYLDDGYARLYRDRLAAAVDAWPGDAMIARETARFLALLMCYEDVARVADLKSRPERLERIRAEARAAPGDPVRVIEFFKPGWDELADLLPPSPAARLRAWAARRGRVAVFERGLELRTTTVRGALQLRLLAAARAWRRRSSRFAAEDALVRRWLAAIVAAPDAEVAREIVLAARLVKGYSDTHRRGRGNFVRILETLVEPAALPPAERARAIRAAREAALAGPEPQRLDAVLAPHGVAPRPPREVPIRLVRPSTSPGPRRSPA
jgi:indolepyruvate ferredoxin oxidoreductase beta subunit